VQTALAARFHNRTVVIIAHRLSTIAAADTIHVMAGGRIVESGTHDALVAAGGPYATLVKRQQETGRPAEAFDVDRVLAGITDSLRLGPVGVGA